MAIVHRRVATRLPIDETFAFIADFANNPRWDPGTTTAERIDAGPVGVGARYRLNVRMGGRVAPMEYRIITFEPSRRVVLRGEGSNVSAVDDIRFEPDGDGTIVDYRADIRLTGWMRLLAPFAGSAFRKIGDQAAAGMRRALEELAAERPKATVR
jgi:carbon monoxide dehydrogenase subunit G